MERWKEFMSFKRISCHEIAYSPMGNPHTLPLQEQEDFLRAAELGSNGCQQSGLGC